MNVTNRKSKRSTSSPLGRGTRDQLIESEIARFPRLSQRESETISRMALATVCGMENRG